MWCCLFFGGGGGWLNWGVGACEKYTFKKGARKKINESTGSHSSTEKRNCSFFSFLFLSSFSEGWGCTKTEILWRKSGGGGGGGREVLSRVYKMRQAPSPFLIKDERPL